METGPAQKEPAVGRFFRLLRSHWLAITTIYIVLSGATYLVFEFQRASDIAFTMRASTEMLDGLDQLSSLLDRIAFQATVLVAGLSAIALTAALVKYLNMPGSSAMRAGDRTGGGQRVSQNMRVMFERYRASADVRLDALDQKLDALRARTEAQSATVPEVISESARAQIVEALRARLSAEVTGDMLAEIEARYGDPIRQAASVDAIDDRIGQMRDRLVDEIEALRRRGNLNLILGTLATSAALAITLWYVTNTDLGSVEITLAGISAYYLPRVSVAIFVQVFAFFFLRLYRYSLTEIKYFQNELTNVEARWVALRASVEQDEETRREVVRSLATTERNFVLKKGETTVPHGPAVDPGETKGIIEAISGLITSAKK